MTKPTDIKPSGTKRPGTKPFGAKATGNRASGNRSRLRTDAKVRASELELGVRRLHRRDLNKVWDFLKLVFRDVNRQTVEYQRPRLKKSFFEIYEEEGVEQLVFEARRGSRRDLVGYAEYAYEIVGADSWINHRYFEDRDMRPLFVQELAVHPDYHGFGIGSFMLEQVEHAARLRGCTHVILEVAENNDAALQFYRKRSFQKIDAAIFLSRKLDLGAELLGPRIIKLRSEDPGEQEA